MTHTLRSLVVLSALFAFGVFDGSAEAGVSGKTYNIAVTRNFVRDFDDFYAFRSGGIFLSQRGGPGQWSQVNFVVFSVWTADFGAGSTRVSFVGVQFGSTITGFGSNEDGDIFQSMGTEGPFDGVLVDEGINLYIED